MQVDPPKEAYTGEALSNLYVLIDAVREMIPSRSKPIPASPDRFNLLAQSRYRSGCRVCGLPGHTCPNVYQANKCRAGFVSLIGFWEDIADRLWALSQISTRFRNTMRRNEVTYEMRLDPPHPSVPFKGGDFDEVVVDRLSRNYLKLQCFFDRIRPKAAIFSSADDIARFQQITQTLNDLLLNGRSYSDLFDESVLKREEDVASKP